jgi:hypothetical protein
MAMAKLINVVAVEGSVLSDVSTEAIREVFYLFNPLKTETLYTRI